MSMKKATIKVELNVTQAWIVHHLCNQSESPSLFKDSRYGAGGQQIYEHMKKTVCYSARAGIRDQVRGFLNDSIEGGLYNVPDTGVSQSIQGYDIEYTDSGIKVGCQEISLDEMRAMIKECEESS